MAIVQRFSGLAWWVVPAVLIVIEAVERAIAERVLCYPLAFASPLFSFVFVFQVVVVPDSEQELRGRVQVFGLWHDGDMSVPVGFTGTDGVVAVREEGYGALHFCWTLQSTGSVCW